MQPRSARFLAAAAALSALCGAAAAQSLLRYQARIYNPANGPQDNWTDTLSIDFDTRIEVRALVDWAGPEPAPAALSGAVFQPVVSNWKPAVDSFIDAFPAPDQPGGPDNFIASGQGFSGGVQPGDGNYGRILPFSGAGITTALALRTYTNTAAGVNYLRIAQTGATNWVGVGSSSTSTNNVTGTAGVVCTQRPPLFVSPTDPPALLASADIPVFIFSFTVGYSRGRTEMLITTPPEGLREITPGVRGFTWYSVTALIGPDVMSPATVSPAHISVWTPEPCPPDINGDWALDDQDFPAFFIAFEAGDPVADVNQDDAIDDLDITSFFTLFELGC